MTTMRNFVQLIGRAGNDPDVRTTNNGVKIARLSIATKEFYLNEKGDRVESTTWHRLVAWSKMAELIEKNVKKGLLVAIKGKLTNNNWLDKDGQKHQITEINVSEFMLMSTPVKENANA